MSLAVTGLARLGGLGDVPDHRSSHHHVTPTAGGLGIIAGVGATILMASLFHSDLFFIRLGTADRLASFLSLVFAISVLGLVDDRFELSSRLKMGLILILSFASVMVIGPVTKLPYGTDYLYLLGWVGVIGSVLWMFTVTNAVNFMDGVNGMFATSLCIASLGLCALALKAGAPVSALMSGSLAFGLLGFLPYNLRGRAAVFSGDSGSLGAAFFYAGTVLFLVHEQPNMKLLYAGPLLIMPFLTDVLLTLVYKPFQGVGFLAPHRFHLFQRLARALGSHISSTLIYAILTASMVALVHEAYGRNTLGSLVGFLLVALLFSVGYVSLTRLVRDR